MDIEEICRLVIGKAIIVHSALGPGLLESAYEECLKHELEEEGLRVRKQVAQPIEYKSVRLDHGYRIDLLVEERFVIEIKSVEAPTDVHLAQVLTYLRLGNYSLGILLNFNVSKLKQGIRRVIN